MPHVDNPKKLSHISLCFGYGGIDLGLQRIFGDRLRLAALCEIEAYAVENALAKMEGGLIPPAPIWPDLRTFPWEDFVGVNLVSGGFPCQPFSAPGLRKADSDPRHLFPHILRGVRIARPDIVFLENVEGIISATLKGKNWPDPEGTPILLHVLRELERVGYSATAGIFDASTEGAPHQRKRVFIMAHRDMPRLQGHLEKFVVPKEREMQMRQPAGSGKTSGRWTNSQMADEHGLCNINFWPARPGEEQNKWEPPRTTKGKTRNHKKIESKMDRKFDGTSAWLGESRNITTSNQDLEQVRQNLQKVDSFSEEIRLLGNGCVPHTVERAWRTLFQRLLDK